MRARLVERIGKWYALACGRPSWQRVNKALLYFGARGLGLHNYENFTVSGERYLLDRFIPRTGAPVVFDVGANTGAWASAVLDRNGNASLHLFEPHGALAQELKARFAAAHVNNVAVADSSGQMALYDYSDAQASSHASLVEGVIEQVHGKRGHKVDVPTVTLGEYCVRESIDWIDYLKVDVEGFEYRVLRGARDMLRERRIGVVQFEFNTMNRLAKVFVSDFFGLLGDGYRIYRALPFGMIPLDPGATWMNEQFAFQNLVAVAAPRGETITG